MRRFRLTDVLCLLTLGTILVVAPERALAGESDPPPAPPPSQVLEDTPGNEREPLFPPPSVAVPPAAMEAAPAAATPSSNCDQLWLISSRGLCDCTPCLDRPALQVQRLECGHGWQASSLEEFFAADDPQLVTAFWIHGNDVPADRAAEQGHALFHRIAGGGCRGVRMVIWSWPSDYIHAGVKQDAVVKFHRTNVEPFYVGQVLDRIRPDVPVVLMGYSFGARISTGTLHLLGGGSINGQLLPVRITATKRLPRRAVLLAAAVGRDALAPGHRHSEALSQVDRMVIMINPHDRVLKFFPILDDDGEDALGLSGPAGLACASPELRSRVVLFNVMPYVQKHHLSLEYQKSLEIMACMRDEIMTAGAAASAPEAEKNTVAIRQ
jgi:hypothetical protein